MGRKYTEHHRQRYLQHAVSGISPVVAGNLVVLSSVGSNLNPSAAYTCSMGSGSFCWLGVVTDTIYRHYEQSFDALDDLTLVKSYKTKKIIKDGIEQEVIDIESLPYLRGNPSANDPELINFWDESKVSGFLLGCIKALVIRLEALENVLKQKGENA
jgi:hypothetical protein